MVAKLQFVHTCKSKVKITKKKKKKRKFKEKPVGALVVLINNVDLFLLRSHSNVSYQALRSTNGFKSKDLDPLFSDGHSFMIYNISSNSSPTLL